MILDALTEHLSILSIVFAVGIGALVWSVGR